MAFKLRDNVAETSTTTGSGDIDLAGAVTGYNSFGSFLSTGDTTWAQIRNVDVPTEWLSAVVKYVVGNDLEIVTVLDGTNGAGNAVSFSAGVKQVVCGLPAAAAPKLVGFAYGEYTANASLTDVIPFDDTLPGSSEGTQIISVPYTIKHADSIIRLRFSAVGTVNIIAGITAALFEGTTVRGVGHQTVHTAGTIVSVAAMCAYAAGGTGSKTFSVRAGPNISATARLNGNGASRFWGGAARSILTVEELRP